MPRRKKINDSDILKKIFEVIKAVGATEFSLEDLRETTGLSPATLLQRFGSKKNILYKALELGNTHFKNHLENRASVNDCFVKEIIHIYLEWSSIFSHPKDVAAGLDILKLDITDKKLNRLTRKYLTIRREKIKSLLMLAQKNRELSNSLSIDETAWDLESLWQGSIMLWALAGNGSINKWIIQRFESFFKAITGKIIN